MQKCESPLENFSHGLDLQLISAIIDISLNNLTFRGELSVTIGVCGRFTYATTFGLAMYADISEQSLTGTAQRLLQGKFGLSYLTNPDFLGKRVCEATKELPVEFIQNFYSMSENELLGAPLRYHPCIT